MPRRGETPWPVQIVQSGAPSTGPQHDALTEQVGRISRAVHRHAVTVRSSQAGGKAAGCFPGLISLPPSHRPRNHLTRLAVTSPAAHARCPAVPPGWAAAPAAGRAEERAGIDDAGLPVRSGPGRRAKQGAGREGPRVRGRWFFAAGAVTGRAISRSIGIWTPVRAKPRRPGLAARPVRDQLSRRRRARRWPVPRSRRRRPPRWPRARPSRRPR